MLIYIVHAHRTPAVCDVASCYVPEYTKSMSVASINSAVTRVATRHDPDLRTCSLCCGWWSSYCVENSLVYVDVSAECLLEDDFAIYALKYPHDFIETIGTMSRGEKLKDKALLRRVNNDVSKAVDAFRAAIGEGEEGARRPH
jgi:hypothetical protein